MSDDIKKYINLFESEVNTSAIDNILFKEPVIDNTNNKILDIIQKLESYYIPTSECKDESYENGFYDGIDLALNILRTISG